MCLHLSYLFLDFVISSYIRMKKKNTKKKLTFLESKTTLREYLFEG